LRPNESHFRKCDKSADCEYNLSGWVRLGPEDNGHEKYLLNNLGDAPRPPILGEHIPPKVGGVGGRDILLTPSY